MKKVKALVVTLIIILLIVFVSGYTSPKQNNVCGESLSIAKNSESQMVNMFVTHGHCSTPFAGKVENLKVIVPRREDLGNPLENMKISFEVNPTTFNVCAGEEYTSLIKTPGLFIGETNENISFRSSDVYTMGLNWYQVNGTLTIKGNEQKVKFFVTGIREKNESMANILILEGQMNLYEWGIDYDQIVYGESSVNPTQWMFINMRIDLS